MLEASNDGTRAALKNPQDSLACKSFDLVGRFVKHLGRFPDILRDVNDIENPDRVCGQKLRQLVPELGIAVQEGDECLISLSALVNFPCHPCESFVGTR